MDCENDRRQRSAWRLRAFVGAVESDDHLRGNHPRPIARFCAKALRHGILTNVAGLELEFVMAANAVVEEVLLPAGTLRSDLPGFPTPDNSPHV